jgi:hypothetical protein
MCKTNIPTRTTVSSGLGAMTRSRVETLWVRRAAAPSWSDAPAIVNGNHVGNVDISTTMDSGEFLVRGGGGDAILTGVVGSDRGCKPTPGGSGSGSRGGKPLGAGSGLSPICRGGILIAAGGGDKVRLGSGTDRGDAKVDSCRLAGDESHIIAAFVARVPVIEA